MHLIFHLQDTLRKYATRTKIVILVHKLRNKRNYVCLEQLTCVDKDKICFHYVSYYFFFIQFRNKEIIQLFLYFCLLNERGIHLK